jgi:hypothetical protein
VESFLYGGSIEDEGSNYGISNFIGRHGDFFFPAGDINYGTQLIKMGKV